MDEAYCHIEKGEKEQSSATFGQCRITGSSVWVESPLACLLRHSSAHSEVSIRRLAHCPLEILRCINVRCSSTRWGQTRRRYFPFHRPDRPLWPTAAPQTLLAPLRFFLIHKVLSVPYSVPLTTHFLVPSILWPPPSWLLFYSISAQLPLPKCKVHRHQSFVVNTVRVKCCPSQLHLHPSSTCTMSDIHDMLRELSLYEAASAAPQSAANSGTAGSQYSLRANKSGKPCRPPPPPPVAQSTSIKKAAIPLPSLGNLSHNSTHSGTQIPFSLVNLQQII